MKTLTSASSTNVALLVKECGQRVLVLEVDTRLQTAAAIGRQRHGRGIRRRCASREEDPQGVIDDIAERSPGSGCDLPGVIEQGVVDVHRGSHTARYHQWHAS